MRLGDSIKIQTVTVTETDGDKKETTAFVNLGDGKCIIFPNNSANKQKGEDGTHFSTAYVVVMKKPATLPKEGDTIHIRKEDGSVDKDCRVAGFVTLRRWLKLWL